MVWKKGESGNPLGRMKGVKDRIDPRAYLAKDKIEILNKALELAKAGDVAALKIVIERICPPLKPRAGTARSAMGSNEYALKERGQALITAVNEGSLNISDAGDLMGVLLSQARLIEADELIARLERIEAALKERIPASQ